MVAHLSSIPERLTAFLTEATSLGYGWGAAAICSVIVYRLYGI